MYGAGVQAGQNEYLQPLIDGGKIRAACETAIGEGNPVSAQSFAQECLNPAHAGRPPHTVTADRGYGEKAVEDNLGVRHVINANPRLAGEPRNTAQRSDEQSSGAAESKEEPASSNVDTAGTAPRIDSTEGAKIWVGHGVLAHNLVKISTLPA